MKSIALLLFLALPLAGKAQTFRTDDAAFRLVKVVEGLEYPWSLAFLPDGRMLVTEKDGRLRSITGGKLDPQPVEGLPRSERYGQGGLLEVAVHPSFSQNSLVYISYTARAADGVGTELARARLVGNRLEGLQVLFRQSPKGHAGQHFGGRIVFDRDGYLYLTLGDRGERERAQTPGDHAGSVIRLHDDGRVPKDNPFVKKPGWKAEKCNGTSGPSSFAIHRHSASISLDESFWPGMSRVVISSQTPVSCRTRFPRRTRSRACTSRSIDSKCCRIPSAPSGSMAPCACNAGEAARNRASTTALRPGAIPLHPLLIEPILLAGNRDPVHRTRRSAARNEPGRRVLGARAGRREREPLRARQRHRPEGPTWHRACAYARRPAGSARSPEAGIRKDPGSA